MADNANTNTGSLTEELLRLYELALVAGKAHPPAELAHDFLKILVSRYNLTGASIWWLHEQQPTPLAVLPSADIEGLQIKAELLTQLSQQEKPQVISSQHAAHRELNSSFPGEHRYFCFYPLAKQGFLLMHCSTDDVLTPRMINSLRPVIDTLGMAINGGLAKKRLIESENELRRQKGLLKTLIQTIPDLIWLKDPDGLYLACNERFESFFGASEAQILGKTDYDFVDKDLADFFRENDRKAMSLGHASVNEEWITFASDAHRELLETIKTPMQDDIGNLVGVLGIGRDITERRSAEQALEESETTYRALFDSFQSAIFVIDESNQCINVNQGAVTLFQYPQEWFIGRSLADISAPEHNDLNKVNSTCKKALQDKPQSLEFWAQQSDGTVFPVEMAFSLGVWFGEKVVFCIASDITERKRSADLIERQANYDALTDLPNRRFFLNRMAHTIATYRRHGHVGAVLFIDLDNFKHINDSLGHQVGDLLLKEVANRLRRSVREEDTPARLGGDEFVVMLSELSDDSIEAAKLAENSAEKIIKALCEPINIEGRLLHTSCSIGIAMVPMAEENADAILTFADTAMYQAKEAGKNTCRFYLPSMQKVALERMQIQNALHQAVSENQFELHFQPQVNAKGNIIGAEALLRWNHPEKGLTMPGEFIRVAEESGQILAIGSWVLREAMTCLGAWEAEGNLCDKLNLSINVSPQQFRQSDFVSKVERLLQETHARPSMLTLELTEGVLIENHQDAIEKMNYLKNLGIRFSIDDFGTGYSSLSYLKQLPVDEIKIDRAFVRGITSDPDDASLVATVLTLADHFKLAVVAEGVESDSQFQFLREHDCNLYQGFLFGCPLPVSDFKALLHQH